MKTLVIRIIRNSLVGQQSADLRKPGCKLKATAASSCNAKSEKQKASPSDFIRDRMLSKRASVLLSGPCQEQFIRFGMSSSMPKIQCHAQLWAYALHAYDLTKSFLAPDQTHQAQDMGSGRKSVPRVHGGNDLGTAGWNSTERPRKPICYTTLGKSDLHIAKEATNG